MLTTPKNKGELFLASSLCDGLEDTNIKQVTTLILNKEADPNVLIPTHGITPFHLVIGNDSEIFAEEVTKLFLRHGGNPNVKSVDGLTPVHVAAAWGRIRILELLLANGGDPLQLDDEGRSPFHYAFDGKYYKIITLLGNYCGYSVGEDDKPKYKMSLDKIVLNNGNTIAEYIIPKNVSSDKNYNNNSSKMILRYCNEETSSGICDSYMISTISSLASKQDLKESDLEIKFEKLSINENVKKEKFLISEIINSLSSTLTSDSTVSEATFAHVNHEKQNIPKKSCILPLLSSSQKTSSNLNSIKPKKKYFSSKFKQKNILDNSIITTSPNFYTPINTRKKQNIIKTSNVKSSSPSNNPKNKHAKSIVTPCSSKYYKSPAPNEYNQQKKEMIQSTPRRKQRREQISYKDLKKYMGNRIIKNNFALENSNETYNHFSSNTSTLSLSPDDSCYPESRINETYVDKRLAVKLHESKYDENIILSYDDTSPNLTESDDPAISLTNLENINNINNNNKHEHNNDLYEICSNKQSLVKLTKLKKTMTYHCIPKIDKDMKKTVNVDEQNLLNITEISNLQNNQVDACNASERNFSVSRSSISYVSVQEEYKYEDREEGVILVERRKCITPASIQEDNEKNESSFCQNKTNSSGQSNFPSELLMIDNYTLRQKLTKLGDKPGPITNTTRHLYLKRLVNIQNKQLSTNLSPLRNISDRSNQMKPWLAFGEWINDLNLYGTIENDVFKEFVSPDPSRRWREGTAKTSFNYLLLDPRVTKDLPHRALQLTQSEVWMTFLSSIFYVGKGKRSRPYAHLYDAFNMWVSKEQYLVNTKIKYILDIWNDGYGVICLHVFQNTIPVEAYTREAIMIDTLGIEHLTNCKSGEYYGIIATWSQRDKCRFGRYLLYKALQILLHEGERQLFPEHL
ncbi:spindle assembly checkpoint component MAD1-like [Polistes fuscatus]|uniref:spindle assembly checkpoint component MAD1-like n=1 Tax=Polistes fuscatus TaxID=30207 RepID=UPI001CA7C884|nr:spindle assembly checkpoint component MAD1-like [Polistes fuscatus]XP_043497707.1 spindle assembly checkpoint component MAD1-like [Polistes fuscatus]